MYNEHQFCICAATCLLCFVSIFLFLFPLTCSLPSLLCSSHLDSTPYSRLFISFICSFLIFLSSLLSLWLPVICLYKVVSMWTKSYFWTLGFFVFLFHILWFCHLHSLAFRHLKPFKYRWFLFLKRGGFLGLESDSFSPVFQLAVV